MKKITFILAILICFFICQPYQIAYASNFFWAKVYSDNVLFYAQPNKESAMFVIPKSYFVKITAEQEGFFQVQYKDLVGFVKKDEVSPMNGTPVTPYFVETFRVFLPSGAGLYPSTKMLEDNQILTIPYLYENLIYYGSLEGQTAVPDKSNLWHYCKYGSSDYGYVYSAFVDKLSSPPINNEEFEPVEVSFAKTQVTPLSQSALAFIIIGVSIPTLIVLYLLVKPNLSTQPHKQKSKYKTRKKRDYFEFDPSDLG